MLTRSSTALISDSEQHVVAELTQYRLRCKRFTKTEMKTQKTPDRRVYRDNTFAFFLEIKEIKHDPWLDGLRHDPIFNRLTDDIHTAVKQFDSVNPNLEHPNVLALVNNDHMCGSLDLVGVLTGHLLLEGGGTAPIYSNYSQGRIRHERQRIHLYLWFDAFKADKLLFGDKQHRDRLCTYFGVDP